MEGQSLLGNMQGLDNLSPLSCFFTDLCQAGLLVLPNHGFASCIGCTILTMNNGGEA